MPGLVDSTTGTMFGAGLQWQPSIGGPGLSGGAAPLPPPPTYVPTYYILGF